MNERFERVLTYVVRRECHCFCDDFVLYEGLDDTYNWESLCGWLKEKRMGCCSGCRAKLLTTLHYLTFFCQHGTTDYKDILDVLALPWLSDGVEFSVYPTFYDNYSELRNRIDFLLSKPVFDGDNEWECEEWQEKKEVILRYA